MKNFNSNFQSKDNFQKPVLNLQAIYNWTRGENMPTIDNLIVLSEIFGVTINEIVVTDTVEIELRKSA